MKVGQGGEREKRIWHVGPARQRRRGEGLVPIRVIAQVGCGPDLGIGRMASPWPFLPFLFLFHFSFSVLRNCFKSFAKMLQTTSNKILNYSNHQGKI
jgi:hypothetical protein